MGLYYGGWYKDVQFTLGGNGSLLGRWYREVQFTLGVNGTYSMDTWYSEMALSH